MTDFLKQVCSHAQASPDRCVFFTSSGSSLTYGELDKRSDALATHLLGLSEAPAAVALLGHKEPDMLVGMIASMKAGLAYSPLDSSLPKSRVMGIMEQLGNPYVLEVGQHGLESSDVESLDFVTRAELDRICDAQVDSVSQEHWISGEDTHYILFTSGSTGTPKGVVIPARAIDCTYRYFSRFNPQGEGLVFFNRAHFSFDLSLFDIAMALPFGHTLFALEAEAEESLKLTFEALHKADVNVWVSSPSFLNLCQADPSFNTELLPNLQSIVVCGETLHVATAQGVLERFAGAKLYNTYGPTETQAAVTDVEITSEHVESGRPLPIGTISPFNELRIENPETHELVADGTHGEIVICGQTVGTGYFGRPDLTEKAFGTLVNEQGEETLYYRTGDEGYIDEDGVLQYIGRYDFQVKINGFRIELQEIEETLIKYPEIKAVCVVPVERKGIPVALAAHVSLSEGVEGTRDLTKELKERLRETLTSYMIPRTIKYWDELPSNANGKIDRKALMKTGSSRS